LVSTAHDIEVYSDPREGMFIRCVGEKAMKISVPESWLAGYIITTTSEFISGQEDQNNWKADGAFVCLKLGLIIAIFASVVMYQSPGMHSGIIFDS
jgi:hypothetical protein